MMGYMRVSWRILFSVWILLGVEPVMAAKYKIRDLQLLPAAEYSAHQDFQEITIGARPCITLGCTLELFDTKKLHEKGILPVLIVVENRNPFAVELDEKSIYLISTDNRRHETISYPDVLITLSSKKPLSHSTGKKDLQARQSVKKEMYVDFETKSFKKKTIAPQSIEYGVVFFERPRMEQLSAARLYFPEIRNVETNSSLIFFEFDLLN